MDVDSDSHEDGPPQTSYETHTMGSHLSLNSLSTNESTVEKITYRLVDLEGRQNEPNATFDRVFGMLLDCRAVYVSDMNRQGQHMFNLP